MACSSAANTLLKLRGRQEKGLGSIDEGTVTRKINTRIDSINRRVVRIGGNKLDKIPSSGVRRVDSGRFSR
jgi:hypothetical protein